MSTSPEQDLERALDRYVDERGLDMARHTLLRWLDDHRDRGGHPIIDDDALILEMNQLFREKPGLTLMQAARQVADRHQDPAATVNGNDSFVRRLVRKFPFAFDVKGRGFDQGKWWIPSSKP